MHELEQVKDIFEIENNKTLKSENALTPSIRNTLLSRNSKELS